MFDPISQLFNDYYAFTTLLEMKEKELQKLKSKPVSYNGETDIRHLFTVQRYHSDIRSLETKMDKLTENLVKLNDSIIDTLASFSIPPGQKMKLRSYSYHLAFWYDEQQVVYFEEVGRK